MAPKSNKWKIIPWNEKTKSIGHYVFLNLLESHPKDLALVTNNENIRSPDNLPPSSNFLIVAHK